MAFLRCFEMIVVKSGERVCPQASSFPVPPGEQAYSGTPEARRMLKALAGGQAEAPLTRAAKDAMGRMEKNVDSAP
jgi:hypothetical protein